MFCKVVQASDCETQWKCCSRSAFVACVARCSIVLCKVVQASDCETHWKCCSRAAGVLLVHVLRAVLLCFARLCKLAFVKRIGNAAAGVLLMHVLCAVLLCFANFWKSHYKCCCRIAFGEDWILAILADCIFFLKFCLKSLQNRKIPALAPKFGFESLHLYGLCAVLLCFASFCNPALVRRIANAAAGVLLVHVLCAVLLCFARLCKLAFVKRIGNAATGVLLLRVLCAVFLCLQGFASQHF